MEKYFEISQESLQYLKEKDPIIKRLIEKIGLISKKIEKDPFTALVTSIIHQQVATSAANSIWNKFMDKIGVLTPLSLLEIDFETLRSCGLSSNKIAYLKDVTKYFMIGYENIDWDTLSDDEVIDKLTQINGVGVWTAKMFLINCLERKNICPYSDLGLKYGVKKLYKMEEVPTEEEFNEIVESYAPYKTIAAFYIWELFSDKDLDIGLDIDYKVNSDSKGKLSFYSKMGWIKIETKDDKLLSLDFIKYPDFSNIKISNTIIKVIREIEKYLDGNLTQFSVECELNGTEFQTKVWNELMRVPYGTTISYQELALRIGDKKSARAVGMANNKNKIAIIVPCHRIVGKDGSLTGYAGGIDIKEKLIELERKKTVDNN